MKIKLAVILTLLIGSTAIAGLSFVSEVIPDVLTMPVSSDHSVLLTGLSGNYDDIIETSFVVNAIMSLPAYSDNAGSSGLMAQSVSFDVAPSETLKVVLLLMPRSQ